MDQNQNEENEEAVTDTELLAAADDLDGEDPVDLSEADDDPANYQPPEEWGQRGQGQDEDDPDGGGA